MRIKDLDKVILDDFNSSDFGFGDNYPRPYTKADHKSMETLFERRHEDRVMTDTVREVYVLISHLALENAPCLTQS